MLGRSKLACSVCKPSQLGLLGGASATLVLATGGDRKMKRGLKRGNKKGRQRVEKKCTCGSTVFSTGHPRQYSLAPAMLVCADRTRRGRFIAVWPQM